MSFAGLFIGQASLSKRSKLICSFDLICGIFMKPYIYENVNLYPCLITAVAGRISLGSNAPMLNRDVPSGSQRSVSGPIQAYIYGILCSLSYSGKAQYQLK